MRAPTRLRSAVGLMATAILLQACSNPPPRRPDRPPPRTAAPPAARSATAPARPLAPLSPEGLETCRAWRETLDAESANLDRMDRQVTDARRALDDEERRLTLERASVDTRYLEQVRAYGRHVEENRRRVQAWNAQVDTYNARVVAYNQHMRTFQSGCARRMPRIAEAPRPLAREGAAGPASPRAPAP